MRIRRVRRTLADRRGMTVGEVLLAVAILGVALAGLAGAIPAAAYAIQDGKQMSTAVFLAEERLEQVRNAMWQEVGTATGPVLTDLLGLSLSRAAAPSGAAGAATFPDENPVSAPFGDYWRTVRIAQCGAAPDCGGIAGAGLRQVTVTVGYRAMTIPGPFAPASTRSVTLTTYVARR